MSIEWPRCTWCDANPGKTHKDTQNNPLFNLTHHAGRWIDMETDQRISEDGA